MGESHRGNRRATLWAGKGAADGYLHGESLSSYLGGTEQAAYVLTNTRWGIGCEEGRVRPDGSGRAAMAFTDERVLGVVEGSDTREFSVPYTELRTVDTEKGLLTSGLTLAHESGTEYYFPVRGRTDLADVSRFVRRAIDQWAAVERRIRDAREELSTVTDHLSAGETAAAEAAQERARELLAGAKSYADEFKPGETAMSRRIQQVETRVYLTALESHRTRADRAVQAAERARDHGEYETALARYRDAREGYADALALAEEHDVHEYEAVQSAMTAVEQAVGQLSTEPLVEMVDACEAALDTTEPAPAAWHDALAACDDLRELLVHEGRFEGDPDAVRMQQVWVVDNLLEAYAAQGERAQERGDQCRDRGDHLKARQAYAIARDNYRAARDTAREFGARDPSEFEAALDRVAERRTTLPE